MGVLFLPSLPSEVLTVFQPLGESAAVLTIAPRCQPDANLLHAGPSRSRSRSDVFVECLRLCLYLSLYQLVVSS